MNRVQKGLMRVLLGEKALNMLVKSESLSGQDVIKRLDELDVLSFGGRTNSGAVVNEDTSMRYAAVYTAVRILSEVIAMLPCHLMESDDNGNTTKATDHPLFKVLYRIPNPWQTAFEFWRYVMVCLLLRGNFYAMITRDGNGRARELIPLDGSRLKITMQEDYTLLYEYTPKSGRKAVQFEPGEILHIRAVGSDNVIGSAPITQARESIGIAIQTEKHAAKMFTNGAKLGLILKHPDIVDDEVAARIKKSFEDAYAGVDNAHKTVLLEQGIEVDKVSMTAEDAQFIEQRKMQRSEVLAIFGVPPHMAGDTEKSTSWGSGIEQQTIGFVTFVLMPHLVNIEQAIFRDVLTEKERNRYYAKFNSDAIIRGDLLSRYKAHEIGINSGFLSPNEAREMENRNAKPGLDEFVKPGKTPPKDGQESDKPAEGEGSDK